jgi:catechol 2,3-dioxygenase-like lactoylglutathione lyase family enzyme
VPGSAQGTFLVVSDIGAARNELIGRGVDVSEVFHFDGDHRPVPGPDPKLPSYGSYASFSDPDGNRWVLQQVKTRLPGRGLSLDVATLTELLRETEAHHGEYEPTAAKHHWSGWYAAYIVARERGRTPDEAVNDATFHIEGGREPVRA